jgi:[ribosomal protein S5]-alanine N-acetyltransferase
MITPTISTDRLILRPLTKATQRQIDWLRDEEVVRYSEQRHKGHTLSAQLHYIRTMSVEPNCIWSISHVAQDTYIGNLTATADVPNNTADVGILIGNKDFWGKGYGLEAWKAACNWLLDARLGNIRKLEAGCMATHIAMRKILDQSGFKFEGERKNHFLFGGMPVGEVFYGRFR